MSDHWLDPDHNDYRASHRVNVCPVGYNVRIFHRGYIISLGADGFDTQVWKESDQKETILVTIPGTSGLSIQRALFWVDGHVDYLGE